MTDEKEPVGDATITTLKKFNPIIILILIALMTFSNYILNSSLTLNEKTILYILTLALFFLASIAEFLRVEKEEELKNQVWR